MKKIQKKILNDFNLIKKKKKNTKKLKNINLKFLISNFKFKTFFLKIN